MNFTLASFGTPLSQLPVDPTDSSSSRLWYTYTTDGIHYEVTAAMESAKYQPGGASDIISNDGGTLATVYEKGSKFGLEPLDYGDPTLVGYWTFDEGSGLTAYDYSGNNATGSWSGIASGTAGYYSLGKIGTWAGTFDGITNHVVPANPINISMNSFSVAAWFRTSSAADQKIVSNNILYHQLQTFSGNLRICVNNCTAGATVVNDGNWHFAVVVGDNNSIRAYLDGRSTPEITETATSTLMSGVLAIGSVGNGNLNGYFAGLIDDVRIYNRALSAAQIAAMYNGGK